MNLRSRKDDKSLAFLLECVGWMRKILEQTQDYQAYLQFLETDFANHLKSFVDHPGLLVESIRAVALPALKNAVGRARNNMRIIPILQELSRMTQASQSTLSNYLRDKILDGSYPRSFLLQLKDIDNIAE